MLHQDACRRLQSRSTIAALGLLASVFRPLGISFERPVESVGVTPPMRYAVDDFFFNRGGEGEWRRRQGR
jgi:hypothetical protein